MKANGRVLPDSKPVVRRCKPALDPTPLTRHPHAVITPRLKCLLLASLLLGGCYAPSGEYGGSVDSDPSGPYGIQGADVVKSEEVGTGFGPYGGIYNYEEVNFGPPSS